MKILIVGAGVAGLAVGWRLAKAGIAVEILERGLAGRGATWASAAFARLNSVPIRTFNSPLSTQPRTSSARESSSERVAT